MTDSDARDYRMARPLVARLAGTALLLLGLLVLVVTLVVVALGVPALVLVVVVVLGVTGLFAGTWWLRERACVVRLDAAGYRVRLIRGAGVRDGSWDDVSEVVAGHPRGIPCLVIHRHDGTTTTVPVEALAHDRDEFALDVRDRLQRAAARRSDPVT